MAAILSHEPALPTRRGARRFGRLGATLGVLWLAAWPLSRAHADATRDACVAAHVQGQELKLASDYAAARARFAICSAARCPAVIRDDCASLLAGLDAALPTVVFAVRTTDGRPLRDARVFVDGQLVSESTDGRAVALTAGSHQLRVEAEGRVPALQQLEIAEDDRERTVNVSLASAAVAASRARLDAQSAGGRGRSLLPVYLLAGSSAAALATGAILGGVGLHKKNDCDATPCSDDTRRTGKRLYVAADVAFGAGAALGVAAVSLYFARHFRRGGGEHALLPIDAQVDARGAALRYRASF